MLGFFCLFLGDLKQKFQQKLNLAVEFPHLLSLSLFFAVYLFIFTIN